MLSDVYGQDLGVAYLRGVVEQRVTSPLLIVGEEGVGRKFAVLQAVREMFCTGTHDAACQCTHCSLLGEDTHPCLHMICPVEGKDIGVEAIREVITESESYPTMGSWSVFIIDGADRMTIPAANALLKVLEEPPSAVRFFLLAESKNNVLLTIQSRCGLVPFQRLPEPFILSMVQRFEKDDAKALVYARLADGSVGRAVQYWGSGRLTLRDKVFALLKLGLKRDLLSLFSAVESLGQELPLGLRFLATLLLDLRMILHAPDLVTNRDLSEELGEIARSLSDTTWHAITVDLRRIQTLSRTTHIALPFHVKTMLTAALGS